MLDCFVCLFTICRFNNSTHERYSTNSQAVNKGLGRTIEKSTNRYYRSERPKIKGKFMFCEK